MEVSQLDHVNSHAVIGGGAAQAYGVEDNAEFYEMLSATMYSNKPLAAVREVLCNAWDAHLMVARPDLAVEVTLTEKEFVVKDFGPGISQERIVPIYCVYGKSTKAHDGKQTGGFGLGSKAPFAYSKHFTVVSCHKGTRTVWAASRGSAATDGKPDFRPMVSVPCGDETGITVTIPVAGPADRDVFMRLVQDLTFAGGMKVKLNGESLPTIDYDKAEYPFVVVNTGIGRHHRQSQAGFFVRYGAVVYPVEFGEGRADQNMADELFMSIGSSAVIVLTAPPNSLGVTPSRESLSYTEKTINTLNDLVKKASEAFVVMSKDCRDVALEVLRDGAQEWAKAGNERLKKFTKIQNEDDVVHFLIREALPSGRRSLDLPVMLSKDEITRAVVSVMFRHRNSYGRNGTRAAAFLKPNDEANLRDHLLKSLYSGRSDLKRYLNRLRVSKRLKDEGHYTSRSETRALRHSGFVVTVTDSFERMIDRLDQFNVRPAFGYFSYDGFQDQSSNDFLSLLGVFGDYRLQANLKNAKVVFSPSRAAARRYANKNDMRRRNAPTLLLITTRKADIQGATDFLSKCGFQTFLDASSEVIKRDKIEASEAVYIFGSREKDEAAVEYEDGGAFYAYGTLIERRDGKKVVSMTLNGIDRLRDTMLTIYPGIVAALNSTDARRLERQGLKNILVDLADKITAFGETPEGMMALSRDLDVITKMAEESTEIGELIPFIGVERIVRDLDPSIPLDMPVSDEAVKFAALIGDLRKSDFSGEKMGAQHVTAALRKLDEKVKATFTKVIEALKDREMSNLANSFYVWRLRDGNPAVTKAIVTAGYEATRLQLSLKTA